MPGTGIFSPKCAMSPFSPVSLFPFLFIFLFFSYPRPLRRKRRGENVPPIILCFFPLFFSPPPSPSPRVSFLLFLPFFSARPRCPSEKSINLACGLANVRTIRQRADWWEGMDSWRPRWRRRGREEGGRVDPRLKPCQVNAAASRPTCNKAATILRAGRAG